MRSAACREFTPRELDSAVADYRQQGVVKLARAFDEATLVPLRERADALMLGQVTYPGLFFQHDTTTGRYQDLTFGEGWQGPSLNYRKIEKLELDPLYRALIEDPLLAAIVRRVVAGPAAIYRAVLMNKAASGGTCLPWHQDGGVLWGLSRDPELQIWLALDAAPPEAGCVAYVPGSHRAGLATPLGGLIPGSVAAAAGIDDRIVEVPAEAGDLLLIHNYVWHRSGVNRSGRPRRALTVCYMSRSTQCLRKKRAPRQFTPVFD
jgi:hypothetical protein